MSFLFHLKTLLGSKVAALAGAAVLLGSGAAIASPATPVLQIVPASDGGAVVDGEDEADEAHESDEDEAHEDEAHEADEAPTDELAETSIDGPPADKSEQLKKADASERSENGEGRSEVAEAVHEALSGGLSPGDDGFGQAVAENARGGGNGAAASAAARNANGSTGRGPGNANPKADSTDDATDGRGAAQGRGPDGAGPPGHAKGP